MFKLLNKKKNNKGFTLVELVIVIAILAILVGLLAPQYTKYVEKSKKSADVNNMDELIKAVEVYVIDNATKDKMKKQDAVVLSLDASGVKVGGKTPSTTEAPVFYNAFQEYVKNWDKIVLKGKHWDTDSISVKVAFDEEGGVTLSDYQPTAYADYVKTGDHTVTTE
nr:prepilin-type N-terminal cleavage/methylation domain-containing protein [uncultured Blautia sp.]